MTGLLKTKILNQPTMRSYILPYLVEEIIQSAKEAVKWREACLNAETRLRMARDNKIMDPLESMRFKSPVFVGVEDAPFSGYIHTIGLIKAITKEAGNKRSFTVKAFTGTIKPLNKVMKEIAEDSMRVPLQGPKDDRFNVTPVLAFKKEQLIGSNG